MEQRSLPGLGASAPAAGAGRVDLRSASAQVADILRREIQRGDFAPATRLRQRDVATRLGVSTTPVREAFQALQAEGFLEVESHRGAVVVQPTVADIEEGYAIRMSLEGLAIRHAATGFDVDRLEPLRALVERMRRATEMDKWAALDHEYHHQLNEMAGMPRLLGLIDQLRSGVAFYIESAFDDVARRHAADDDHQALLEACSTGDADRAQRVIEEHLHTTARAVIASLAPLPPGTPTPTDPDRR